MDIIPVSVVVAPFRMVHCVNPEYVFVYCPLTTASMELEREVESKSQCACTFMCLSKYHSTLC